MKKKLFAGLAALCMAVMMSVSAFAGPTETCAAGDCGILTGTVRIDSSTIACATTVSYNPNFRELSVFGNAVDRAGNTVASTGGPWLSTSTHVSGQGWGRNLYAAYGEHKVDALGAGVNTYTNINM